MVCTLQWGGREDKFASDPCQAESQSSAADYACLDPSSSQGGMAGQRVCPSPATSCRLQIRHSHLPPSQLGTGCSNIGKPHCTADVAPPGGAPKPAQPWDSESFLVKSWLSEPQQACTAHYG